jgi:hypothetical protein
VHDAFNVTIEAMPTEESTNRSANCDDACMWLRNQLHFLAQEDNPSGVPRVAVDVRLCDGHRTL